MPYTTVSSGTITAALWNANVRDQVVTPFADAASRDAAITSPLEGMMAYTEDNNRLYLYSQDRTGPGPLSSPYWIYVGGGVIGYTTDGSLSISTGATETIVGTPSFVSDSCFTSGVFTAPENGNYHFTFSLTSRSGSVETGTGSQLVLVTSAFGTYGVELHDAGNFTATVIMPVAVGGTVTQRITNTTGGSITYGFRMHCRWVSR
jgi:hypothetical protein